jgi:2-dehydropantoate 2-reductase
MKIAVVGAGAIGAYVGAALARGGEAEVALIARGPHLRAMQSDGVRVLSSRGDFDARVVATDDAHQIGEVDYVVLGLKAQDYAAARPLIDPLLGPETAVVPAQNGIPWWYFHGSGGEHEGKRIEAVDPGGAVSRLLDPARAIGCVVFSSTEIESPGVIRHVEGTRFTIGEPDGSISERAQRFSRAMIAGGLKCPVVGDIRTEMWLKLMGNAAFNPLSALTRATMVQIARFGPTRTLAETVMRETLEVATCLGCRPEVSVERRLDGAERVGDHRTSMLQDLEAAKALELTPLVVAVIELADLTGVDAPALRAVAAAVELLDLTNRGVDVAAGDHDRVGSHAA